MQQHQRRPKAAAIQILFTVVAIALLLAVYIVVLWLTIGISKGISNRAIDHRDLIYLFVHVGGLVLAAAAGFALGKWFSGLGIAFALLFVVVVSVGMVGAQMGSYALACDAHQNDILRHWTC